MASESTPKRPGKRPAPEGFNATGRLFSLKDGIEGGGKKLVRDVERLIRSARHAGPTRNFMA